jgi:hypothetical protein
MQHQLPEGWGEKLQKMVDSIERPDPLVQVTVYPGPTDPRPFTRIEAVMTNFHSGDEMEVQSQVHANLTRMCATAEEFTLHLLDTTVMLEILGRTREKLVEGDYGAMPYQQADGSIVISYETY